MSDLISLSEVCSLITKGTTPTAQDGGFQKTGINYIKSESLSYSGSIDRSAFFFISASTHDKLRRSQIQDRDILYSIAGANLGKCGIVSEDILPANTNQAVAIIRVDRRRVSPEFVSYVLRNKAFVQMVLGGVAQSAQPNVNLADIGRFKIPAWPLPYQQAVASVLGALDDKININRLMNETLECIGRAIFKDWFVDFGPTRAMMLGRAPYLEQNTWRLFPESLDIEGKPAGWTISTIGDEVEVLGGSTPSTKEPGYWGGDFAWATPKDLSSLSTPVLLSTERRITAAGLTQISSGLLPIGTVLLSSRAPIGYMAIAQIPTAVNQGFIAMSRFTSTWTNRLS
jgi:type I restriction enzyme S subunit